MKKILLTAFIFTACAKNDVSKPADNTDTPSGSVVDKCGTVLSVSSRDVSNTSTGTFEIENTYIVKFESGNKDTVVLMNSQLKTGDTYCK